MKLNLAGYMVKRILAFSLLLMLSWYAYGQQEAQFSHIMFTQGAINPGYTGSNENTVCLYALHRQQWVGFKDINGEKVNPITSYFAADGYFKKISSGVGIVFLKDKLGYEDNLTVRMAYAYHRRIGNGKLGIGLQASFINKKIDFSKYIAKDPNDPLLNSRGIESSMITDFSFGLYYKDDKIQAGLSSTQMAQSDFKTPGQLAKPSNARHYFLYGSYLFDLTPEYKIQPSILLKSTLSSTQYDLSGRVIYKDLFFGGLSIRPSDAAILFAGIQKGQFLFSYGYDIGTSKISEGKRSSGSHEIFLRYCFNIEIPTYPSRHYIPRNL